ncbi:MAG: cobalamin B12-binding domain-containing protein [Phycisphaerales bacterium]|nr:cobalamin B12-binding domain-containing protein [Phycisphaerales bacterium]
MKKESKQASLVVDSVAKAVANWTVDHHARFDPALQDRFGANWRDDWIEHTLAQIHLLAQAIAVNSVALFANAMNWTIESFKARGVSSTDLLRNGECLREVLIKELPTAIGEIASPFLQASLNGLREPDTDSRFELTSEPQYRELVLKYLEAILEGERSRAETLVFKQVDAGLSIPQVYEGVLAPAQAQLGWMWHRGDISVADEHFGSAVTQSVMSQLRPRFQLAAPNGRTVVCTSTPGDLHEIGLQMVSDLFEIDGWTSLFLGANTPVADVVEILERRRPQLLALSVSTALTLRDAGELVEAIHSTASIADTKVLIGGPPFRTVADLWQALGADACAVSATEAVAAGNALVRQ